MSDAEQNLDIEVVEDLDYKAMYEETSLKLESLAAHQNRLLGETQKAKAARNDAAKLAEQVRREAEDTSKKNGEFEKLFNTKAQENEELRQQLEQLTKGQRQEKLQVTAMRIATELADGDNAELLSEFVQRNLNDIADEAGALSAEALTAIKEEFKNNAKFKALLRSSKAIGGGATGNIDSSASSSKLSNADFNSMTDMQKMQVMTKIQKGELIII